MILCNLTFWHLCFKSSSREEIILLHITTCSIWSCGLKIKVREVLGKSSHFNLLFLSPFFHSCSFLHLAHSSEWHLKSQSQSWNFSHYAQHWSFLELFHSLTYSTTHVYVNCTDAFHMLRSRIVRHTYMLF